MLLLKYLVIKRRLAAAKRPAGEISTTIARGGKKDGIGSTGVHLRYHESAKYNGLNLAQKKERTGWHISSGHVKSSTKHTKGLRGGVKTNKTASITSSFNTLVQKKLAEMKKASSKAVYNILSDDAQQAYIMLLFQTKTATNGCPISTTDQEHQINHRHQQRHGDKSPCFLNVNPQESR